MTPTNITPTNTHPPSDDHGASGPPSAEVIARGYESDGYDTKSVLSVPLLVVFFFVAAFGTVSVIFYFIAPTKHDPKAHPAAVERNQEPLNARLKRIGRGSGDVEQPRLEPLKLRSGEARAITRPELHPEDLRPTKEHFPALYSDGKYGLDKTMQLSDKAMESLFPVQKPGTKPANSQHVPTAANAGRGAGESLVVAPGVPKIPALPATPVVAPPDLPKIPVPDPKGGKQ